MTSLDDPNLVRSEYASDERLAQRIAAYRFAEGTDGREVLFDALRELAPQRLLEVGCGQGWLAERVKRELTPHVVAVDQSEHMVEATRARGVEALVADAAALPFDDESFDCVVAAWMLYHVPDLDAALAELSRVLRRGGALVAVTNGVDHFAELEALLGVERPSYSFRVENAEVALGRHFARVEQRDASGWVVFPRREDAQAYVDASMVWRGGRLPPIDGPLRVRRVSAVFVATRP